MKKIITAVLSASLIFGSFSVFAENIDDTLTSSVDVSVDGVLIDDTERNDITNYDYNENGPTSTHVIVNVNMLQQPFTLDSFARLELYSMDGEFLDYDELWIGGTTTELVYDFEVPEYHIGESFILKVCSGITSVQYYDTVYYPGQQFVFSTYSYEIDDGITVNNNSIILDGIPCYHKAINFYYDGVYVDLQPSPRVINGSAMVPVEFLSRYIGLSTFYDPAYNSQVVSLGNQNMYFNVGTTYTTLFDGDVTAPIATQFVDGAVFVSLRTFADALGSQLDVYDNGTYFDIYMHSSPMVNKYFNDLFVNQQGISSRTNNLVWVSLSEYKVRVYEGKQYQWKPIRECTVGIGAPGTPTITGEFEYQYKDTWYYSSYYVGPCLVFYGGYALHSVLLNYDGTEYDGTVGAQVSHGCIRMKKTDIDWLASTIDVGTKIYITP